MAAVTQMVIDWRILQCMSLLVALFGTHMAVEVRTDESGRAPYEAPGIMFPN